MNAYAWWEIGAVAAYALMLIVVWLWPDNGDDYWWDDHTCRDCETLGALDVVLEDYHRRQSPIREACELSEKEEAAWQQIRAGA